MGGDNSLSSHLYEHDGSLLHNEYPKFSCRGDNEWSNGYSSKEDGQMDENLLRKRNIAYREIIERYDRLYGDVPRVKLPQTKNTILSYTPGLWVGNGDDKKRSDYVIPKTTTLLVIGPKGSGKSSLINKISKVFEGDKFATERAQVTFNSSSGNGTHFLQEYTIPRCSSSFCLFDTRSLSGNLAEDYEMLLQWMRDGVCDGELAIRDSDSSSLKIALEYKAQQCGSPSSDIRKVNFVIFVVNGLSVLRAMNGDKEEDTRYMNTVMKTFRCPYLSFRDNKPVVVFTHGDLLSLEERAHVHVYLGEKLDVPPTKQVFDIPENSDSLTESSIVDMMRYSLELADKNLPFKRRREWPGMSTLYPKGVNCEVFKSTIVFTLMFLAVLLGIAVVSFPLRSLHKSYEPFLSSSTNSQCKSHINQLHKPCKPHIKSPSHSGPNRGQDQFHEKRTCEKNQDSHVTTESSMTSKTDPTISAPTTLAKLNTTTPTPTLNPTTSEHEKHHNKSTPVVPAKSNTGLSTPTVSSESDIKISVVTSFKHGPSKSLKRRKKRRHTKPVLEWHKIRHLWAAPEDQHPEPAIEWSEIRHLWGPPEDQHPEPGL